MSRINWSLVWGSFVVLGLIFAIFATGAHARDSGQWEGTDPAIREWYRNLMQPDNPAVSCCGTSDAYWCDGLKVDGDGVFCEITDDRDDASLGRHHVDVGTWIQIPDRKMKYGLEDPQRNEPNKNPTGHAIIFLSYGNSVYCYVAAGGV